MAILSGYIEAWYLGDNVTACKNAGFRGPKIRMPIGLGDEKSDALRKLAHDRFRVRAYENWNDRDRARCSHADACREI